MAVKPKVIACLICDLKYSYTPADVFLVHQREGPTKAVACPICGLSRFCTDENWEEEPPDRPERGVNFVCQDCGCIDWKFTRGLNKLCTTCVSCGSVDPKNVLPPRKDQTDGSGLRDPVAGERPAQLRFEGYCGSTGREARVGDDCT